MSGASPYLCLTDFKQTLYKLLNNSIMAETKRMQISYPSSRKIYVPGQIHKMSFGIREIKLNDHVTEDDNV